MFIIQLDVALGGILIERFLSVLLLCPGFEPWCTPSKVENYLLIQTTNFLQKNFPTAELLFFMCYARINVDFWTEN